MYNYFEENDSIVNTADDKVTEMSTSSGKVVLRSLIALVFFLCFVFFDITGFKIYSVDTTQIYHYLQENYTVNSFAFIEEITYTLTHG